MAPTPCGRSLGRPPGRRRGERQRYVTAGGTGGRGEDGRGWAAPVAVTHDEEDRGEEQEAGLRSSAPGFGR